MEKIVKSMSENLPPSVLYYDDVEKIVEILAESNSEVRIATNEFKLSTVKELKELKKNVIHELSISCTRPMVSIEFRPMRTWLYASEDSPLAKGVYEKIRQYVISKRRRLAWLSQSWLVGIVLGSSTWLLPLASKQGDKQFILLYAGSIIFAGLGWGWWTYKVNVKEYSTIYPLHERHLSSGFIAQNRDKIFLAIITAVISSIITITVTKVLK
jgi:hypothetical protein